MGLLGPAYPRLIRIRVKHLEARRSLIPCAKKARRRHFAGLGKTSLEELPAPLETKESEKV